MFHDSPGPNVQMMTNFDLVFRLLHKIRSVDL